MKKIEGDQSIHAFVNSSGDATWAGLTYRQHFAAEAMKGLLPNIISHGLTEKVNAQMVAEKAVKFADALIEELNKENQ